MNLTAEAIQILIIILLYGIQAWPFGWIIKKATQRWRNELLASGPERDSLTNAGLWIGVLERLLIVTFILAGELGAIGFLMASKSILRFGDRDMNHQRKQSEYILIGTLLSYCFALFSTMLIIRLTGVQLALPV